MSYGSNSTYATSAVKSVVDAWAAAKFTNSELKTVDGYGARLIKYDEYLANCEEVEVETTDGPVTKNNPKYTWMYSSNYWYWTMSLYQDSSPMVWIVLSSGNMSHNGAGFNGIGNGGAVRTVINVYKSKISS